MMKLSKIQIALFVALLSSNAILLYGSPEWLWLRLPAALALTFVLSGWAWLPVFGWLQTNQAFERIVLIVGLSSLFSALALFITVLLPGPFTEMPVFIALNLTIVIGLVCQSIINHQLSIINYQLPGRQTLLILVAILVVAFLSRVITTGYGEFHEDELENMRLIVRAYKGEEYAPFLDSKGPIHWLLPASLWYLNGWLTEGLARAPFAVTGLILIPTMFVLGWRMTGRDAIGLLAAGFVAINGFFVAYARFVENQSLIVFWGALAMWFAYRYYKEDAVGFLPWLALSLAIGLIAHPDMLLYLPAFAYIIWLKGGFSLARWQRQQLGLIGAALLFIILVGAFCVPYLLDPNIALAQQYFANDRIGNSLLYNRVENLFDQDQLYSTRYHAPAPVLLLAWLLARNFARWGRRGLALWAGLGLAMVSTVMLPELWVIGLFNLAFAPYALLTLVVLVLPQTGSEIKILFLWLAAPLGALLFLAKDAADHIQIAYTAWALLSAIALVDIWDCLALTNDTVRLSAPIKRGLKIALVSMLALAASLILLYQYLAFLAPVTTYWQAKIDFTGNPNSVYGWLYGSIPRPRKIFSNPRLGGWKAVGYLWETGQLNGDFRSINESFAVPIWYTFQTPRSCYNDPQHYWVQRDWQGWPEEEQDIVEQGYTLTQVVLVDQQPKLHLYQKDAPPGEPEIIDSEAYRHKFDRLATPARFVQAEVIGQAASLNFGDRLLLTGYNLPQIAAAGELLPVSVYWESLAPMDTRYRAFVHLLGRDETRWAQHDDDPACRLLTTDMRPGQQSSRQFRLPLDPAIPPGEYTVVLGVYHPDTLERLAIWDNWARQSPGDSVVLGKVRVE
jgi:4-amino-4-deoxy-L-arabinose transferase-like glycosyltransferase